MRLTILLLLIVSISFGQNQGGIYAEVGLNRVGVGNELGVKFRNEQLTVKVGAKIYAPNILFQRNYPGLSLGLSYKLKQWKKNKISIGLETGTFFEKKEDNYLLMIDPLIRLEYARSLNKSLTFSSQIGVGAVYNFVDQPVQGKKQPYSYLNYEIGIAITYWFNRTD